MPKDKVGFEYRKKKKETPFETFLRYSNEKKNSARELAKVLRNYLSSKTIHLLDIGSGNGEYLKMILGELNLDIKINFVLLEPSEDLVKKLKQATKFFPGNWKIEIVTQTWERFESGVKFDIILASHLYHIPRGEYYSQFLKMVKLLEPKGLLVFVLREIDDPYDFKMKFKPLLFGKDFEAKTLDDALETFKKISEKVVPLKIEKYRSFSQLHIPVEENFDDAVSIIEFYLNKKWEKIPPRIRKEAVKFIEDKDEAFKQVDGIALIKRLS